jgi:hypothetical protein
LAIAHHEAKKAGFQPFYKLRGSGNWQTEAGEPLLIMGNAKTGAIRRHPTISDPARLS